MKATELQIGDWVRCGRRYMKITQLAEDINCDDVEPIPLVRVHLTKNGFKATNAEDTEFVYRDGYEVKVMIDEYIRDSMFLSIEFADKNIWMPIEYVHQLQQAMRIMGCDKTIEL